MRLSFMTLGCPTWDLDAVCRFSGQYGFEGVDFRGLRDVLDVTRLPAFTTDVGKTARQLSDAGLAVSGISTSIAVCDPTKRTAHLDEARRTIDVAKNLGAQNVRVFGGGSPDTIGYTAAADVGRDLIAKILELQGASDLHWNFETHDHWVKGADTRLLLSAIPDPAFGACWDLGHTYRVGGETSEQTLAALGDRVRYVHVKDAVKDPTAVPPKGDGWRYVLPGTGVLPLAAGIRLLHGVGYDGWLMFEHEKRWHSDLEEPEVAFPAFVRWARATLDALGR